MTHIPFDIKSDQFITSTYSFAGELKLDLLKTYSNLKLIQLIQTWNTSSIVFLKVSKHWTSWSVEENIVTPACGSHQQSISFSGFHRISKAWSFVVQQTLKVCGFDSLTKPKSSNILKCKCIWKRGKVTIEEQVIPYLKSLFSGVRSDSLTRLDVACPRLSVGAHYLL